MKYSQIYTLLINLCLIGVVMTGNTSLWWMVLVYVILALRNIRREQMEDV